MDMKQWNAKQKRLRACIRKEELVREAIDIAKALHGEVHRSVVYDGCAPTYMDELVRGLTREAYEVMPTIKDDTIAWHIWHMTRIEDLTMGFLVCQDGQVWNAEWKKGLGVDTTDTGNAMTDAQMLALSKEIDLDALLFYRDAVGVKTKRALDALTHEDMRRKVPQAGIAYIQKEGGVTEHPDSIWLLDFWGKKDVAGILLMPVTRHQISHLNGAHRLKEKILRKLRQAAIDGT